MKKCFTFLLAMLMTLSLCSCCVPLNAVLNKPADTLTPETLEGEWVMKMDVTSLLKNGGLGSMSELAEGINFSDLNIQSEMGVTFRDGKIALDLTDFANLYQDTVDAILDWLMEGDNLFEMFAANNGGMSAEAFKEYMELSGTTKEAMIELIKSALPDSDALIAELQEDGELEMCYELVDDKLYTWKAEDLKDEDNYMLLSYSKGVITVIETVDGDDVIRYADGTLTLVRK